MFKLRISYFTSSVNGNNEMPQTQSVTLGFGATELRFLMKKLPKRYFKITILRMSEVSSACSW